MARPQRRHGYRRRRRYRRLRAASDGDTKGDLGGGAAVTRRAGSRRWQPRRGWRRGGAGRRQPQSVFVGEVGRGLGWGELWPSLRGNAGVGRCAGGGVGTTPAAPAGRAADAAPPTRPHCGGAAAAADAAAAAAAAPLPIATPPATWSAARPRPGARQCGGDSDGVVSGGAGCGRGNSCTAVRVEGGRAGRSRGYGGLRPRGRRHRPLFRQREGERLPVAGRAHHRRRPTRAEAQVCPCD